MWNSLLASRAFCWQASSMQKPNYQFEKRRKEMDKKAKKDEKRRLKLAATQAAAAGNSEAPPAPVEPA
jgi:hypothetical protein